MKNLSYIYILTVLAIWVSGCKKEGLKNPTPLLSSFRIVNAFADSKSLFVNRFSGGITYAGYKDSIKYGNSHEYGIPNGMLPLQLVSSRDTTRPLFNGQFNLSPLKAYSFYITGYGNTRDTVYKTEDIIPRYTDSAVAVRVINLAIGGPKINVSLSTSPQINEFSGLDYKAQSSFKKYTLTKAVENNGSLTFNITDAATGNRLVSYNLPRYSFTFPPLPTTSTARFKALTLVVAGDVKAAPNTQNAFTIFPIANY